MVLGIENILLIGSILLLISLVAGKTSYRFGVPTLILFLGIGMLAGSEGIGGIHFDDPGNARFIGIIALNFILFSGGLDTNWTSIKPCFWKGLSLSSLGVLLTAVSLGTFVWLVTDFTLYEGLLLGAIVSSTDAAAVFSILRSKNLALKGSLRSTLEFESGSNDPMAYVLTIAFLGLVINQDKSLVSVIPMFVQQMAIGGIAGYFLGKISRYIINHIRLDFEGLYPVLVIAMMFFTFSATDFVGGNGFLAVYICAVYLANHDLIHKKTIMKVFDGLAWLFQIVLFLSLGLLVYPSQIIPIIGIGLLISFFLIVIARPLSVMLSLVFFRMRMRNRLYISWVGLRGAVPIVFATYPLLAGIEKAEMIFNIVFFVSVTSVIIQGTTLPLVAKWLHVALPARVKRLETSEIMLAEGVKSAMIELTLPPGSPVDGRQLVDIHFPHKAIIAMIKRGNEYITPNGATLLQQGDKLVILAESEEYLGEVYKCLGL
ncbi:MAG: potassium/proton antiporter [Bacteroidales bacterium]|nr:potassium/proton antiporter [Bacteroidales bacterium]